jgi:hypothetical protein
MRGLKLQRYNDCWVGSQAQRGQVLAFQMKRYGFAEIPDYLVQSGALGDHRNFQALADIAGLLAGANRGLDRALKHLWPRGPV